MVSDFLETIRKSIQRLCIVLIVVLWGCGGGSGQSANLDEAPNGDDPLDEFTVEVDDDEPGETTLPPPLEVEVETETEVEIVPDPEETDEPCVPTPNFFAEKVWAPLMGTKCISCHNNQGAAKGTKLVLKTSALTGYMEHNLATVQEVATYEYNGASILLLKPTLQMDHAGGQVLSTDSEEYGALVELVERFKNPVECVIEELEEDFFDDVELMSPFQTFRNAALLIGGRAPTIEEFTYFDAAGDGALDAKLDGLLQEDAFYEWLKEVYNDQLLTDRYKGGDNATNLMNATDYPDRKWYREIESTYESLFLSQGLQYANNAVAQEALELIVYVVRNNLPFTEILTADYTLVNPFSAVSYGVSDLVGFEDSDDPAEFQPVQLPGIPHAGLLTSVMFLNRFPTTATNRNRHRSRMIYQFFLATDVMKLAERPIDPTSIQDHNPTMFNPDCSACHEVIDPLGGAFQNWDDRGRYVVPEEGWHADMLPTGFGEDVMPYEERHRAAQWLSTYIASDPRFALATVRTIYTGLTGHAPITAPSEEEEIEDFASYKFAFDTQDSLFKTLAADFEASDYDLRVVVKGLILSPYFRAVNGPAELTAEEEIEFMQVGAGRLATPEQLHRRIWATTGFPWRASRTAVDNLTTGNLYQIFYGGIDSVDITRRITDPNGIMVAVQQRMANELACLSTSRDFSKSEVTRLLFPYVEISYVPEDGNDFPIPQAEEAIRENIRYLHAHVLGEMLNPGDTELEITYNLFYETWLEGTEGIEAGTHAASLHWSCQSTKDWWTDQAFVGNDIVSKDPLYTVRAWSAVITYLLTDSRFLYQ